MATKRPISTQRIPDDKKTSEKTPDRHATIDNGAAVVEVATPPGPATGDTGESGMTSALDIDFSGDTTPKEQALAEATTPRENLHTDPDRPDGIEARPSASISDGLLGNDPEVDLIATSQTVPTREELTSQLDYGAGGGGSPGQEGGSPGGDSAGRDGDQGLGTPFGSKESLIGSNPRIIEGAGGQSFFEQNEPGLTVEEAQERAGEAVRIDQEANETTLEVSPAELDRFDRATEAAKIQREVDAAKAAEAQAVADEEAARQAENEAAERAAAEAAPATSPAPSQPDPENEGAPLSEDLQRQFDEGLADLRAQKPSRNPDDGAIDPVEDDAAFGAGGTPAGPVPDAKDRLLGGDTGERDVEIRNGGTGGTNPNSGFTDPSPDAADNPQSSGPERDLFPQNNELVERPPSDTDDTDDTGISAIFVPVDPDAVVTFDPDDA